ncbi:MAG: hypothetical protein ACUZ8I_07975 [Candidatus Scalindua sp.]
MFHDNIELMAAKFVAITARSVPDKLISSVFASPLSARSPDLCMLWHPVYRKNHSAKLFFVLLLSMFYSSLKGIIKLATNHKHFGYAIYGKVEDSILVVPSICGIQTSEGEYKTSYVDTVKGDALFVFGPFNSCGTNSVRIKELLLAEKLILIYSLAKSGLRASVRLDCRMFDNILLLLVWFSWALSFQWLNDYYLEKSLSKTVKKYNIQKIGCIHEMHSYVRVVWRVAKKYKAKSYTIQHAAISPGKRWYFCYPEEIERGLKLPDVMYVYNEKVVNTLKEYYKDTRFSFGCSARYSHWKNVEKSEKKGKYYLFVGALAGFDNDVLITTLSRLLKASTELLPVRLRLHPFAKISYGVKRWIRTSSKKGIVEISNNTSLRDDLENAAVVIGMSTTVLEESLLLGRPVIQINHPDFREFIDIGGVEGSIKRNYRELLLKDLIDASSLKVDHMEMRKRLGLQNEIIDYKRLFAR